jgi:hypothetical protein
LPKAMDIARSRSPRRLCTSPIFSSPTASTSIARSSAAAGGWRPAWTSTAPTSQPQFYGPPLGQTPSATPVGPWRSGPPLGQLPSARPAGSGPRRPGRAAGWSPLQRPGFWNRIPTEATSQEPLAARPSPLGEVTSRESPPLGGLPGPAWRMSSRAAAAPAAVPGLGPLRAGGPARNPRRQGAPPQLHTEVARNLALESMTGDIYAASSVASVTSRRRCVHALLAEWGLEPYPLSAAKLQRLGASLHAGGYRSASSVLSLYTADAERRGERLSPEVLRVLADVRRACRRGQGPPVRAAPLPLERLGELPGGPAPWVRGGPVGPRNAIVVGAWWLLREIELANLRAALADLAPSSTPTMTLSLPASKSDAVAHGVSRCHACLCTGAATPTCPVHAGWDQLLVLRAAFPSRFAGSSPHTDLPMFPDVRGRAVIKSAFVATIRHAAALLGVPAMNAEGTLRVTGHSLRPTGAQGLARLGLDAWTIQRLGRWGGPTVLDYVRDALAGPEAAVARRATLVRNLRGHSSAREGRACESDVAARALAEVRAQLPAFLAELRASLAREVPAPPAQPRASSSGSSSSSTSAGRDPGTGDVAGGFQGATSRQQPFASQSRPVPRPVFCVASAWTATRHRIAVGPDSIDLRAAWQTACGWRFGSSSGRRASRDTDTNCLRCYPAAAQLQSGAESDAI